MVQLLEILNKKYDNHYVRYAEIAEDTMDNPIEVRVKDGSYWAMTYCSADLLEDHESIKVVLRNLDDTILEEKADTEDSPQLTNQSLESLKHTR